MPNTYVALKTETVAIATPSVTFDLTGISGYTDLVLVVSARSTYAAAEVAGFIRVGNGSIDTGSNYSRIRLLGTGSAASSARASNLTATPWDAIPGSTSASGNFCTTIISIQNYSNTTTYKTFLIRANEPNNYVEAEVGLWRSTSAINQVQIYGDGGGDLAVGSTFSLYGIANADQGSAQATGGIITEDSQYWYHTFGASGAFIPKQSLTCDVLVVAGGGSGSHGSYSGAGGGAGGYLELSSQALTSLTNYSISVGAGGATPSANTAGNDGSNSLFSTLGTAIGGGGAGGGGTGPNNGRLGGSGGGGATNDTSGGGVTVGGAGTSGQGFAGGGNGNLTSTPYGSGGGGGAGGVGATATGAAYAGAGGVGKFTTLSNAIGSATGLGVLSSSNYYFAGGGGGATHNGTAFGAGGLGGGGRGGVYTGTPGTAGTVNTGGGGGSGTSTTSSAAGGSGVVIVRYAKV